MTRKAAKTGKELEWRVADAYRQMGARKVQHDVEMAGNQVDVYVELETPGRLLHRIAVEAKDWAKPVGIDIVNEFATIVNLLRQERRIEEGVIISLGGFTKQARNAAVTYGIQLLEIDDLDAMVAQVRAIEPTQPAESFGALLPIPSVDKSRAEASETTDATPVGVSRKTHRTESLDARVLRILHTYYQLHGGDPKMELNELVKAAETKREDVIKCLYGLREKNWVGHDLTVKAERGLVWITPLGIRVAESAS